jgi:hypothetical protein
MTTNDDKTAREMAEKVLRETGDEQAAAFNYHFNYTLAFGHRPSSQKTFGVVRSLKKKLVAQMFEAAS